MSLELNPGSKQLSQHQDSANASFLESAAYPRLKRDQKHDRSQILKVATEMFFVLSSYREPVQMYPDAFFQEVIRRFDRKAFSKKEIGDVLRGAVDHPGFETVIHPSNEEVKHNLKALDDPAEIVLNKLLKSRDIYSRPIGEWGTFTGSCGDDVLRYKLLDTGLTIYSMKNRATTLCISQLGGEIVEDRTYWTSYFFPKERFPSPLSLIKETINILPDGERMLTDTLDIPLVDGSSWEIRTIIQSPFNAPRIAGQYVKHGDGDFVNNISGDGKARKPKPFLHSLFTERLEGHHPGMAAALTEMYLSKVNAQALRAREALNHYLNTVVNRYLSGIPSHLTHIREVAIDSTGTFTTENPYLLKPTVIECQYPGMTLTGLKETDDAAHQEILATREEMRERGYKTLERILYPTITI